MVYGVPRQLLQHRSFIDKLLHKFAVRICFPLLAAVKPVRESVAAFPWTSETQIPVFLKHCFYIIFKKRFHLFPVFKGAAQRGVHRIALLQRRMVKRDKKRFIEDDAGEASRAHTNTVHATAWFLYVFNRCAQGSLHAFKTASGKKQSTEMGHVNIEIKARCDDHDRIRNVLQAENAEKNGVDNQVDTYFTVADGRLKLRQGDIENYLIFYNREDAEGPKQSTIQLYDTSNSNPDALKNALTQALGIDVVVEKTREIWFVDNVKIHLDTVETLGTFVEIEAIDKHGDMSQDRLQEQCTYFMNQFNIEEDDLVAVSYSDLINEQEANQ